MKKVKKLAVVFVFLIAVGAGFYAGTYVTKRDAAQAQEAHYHQVINLAVPHVQKLKGGYDDAVMKNLISKIYAAYELAVTDEGSLAMSGALHELWNALIFDGENIAGKEDALIQALQEGDTERVEKIAREMRTGG